MIYTFPTAEELEEGSHLAQMPDSVSFTPYAVWWEGALRSDECMAISFNAANHEPYKHDGCDATHTRTVGDCLELDTVDKLTRQINDIYFQYDLHEGHKSWHQTYGPGAWYQPHADMAPGISRKLTAIVMLTDRSDYGGGELELYFPPIYKKLKLTAGSIVWIQPWLIHQVLPVKDEGSIRETINMGFFGPPFR